MESVTADVAKISTLEVMSEHDYLKWIDAITSEVTPLIENNTWRCVNKLNG